MYTYNSKKDVISAAKYFIEEVVVGEPITSPQLTKDYLIHQLGTEEREVFCVLHLDAQHRVLEFEKAFFGTIDSAAVYPREVVKSCLAKNTAAVIFAHNHPSGLAEPSKSDERITERLKEALSLVDVRTLDHIIVGGSSTVSLAERGLL